MVSSLDNWDGSRSSEAKQNGSRITDLVGSAGSSTTTVPGERSNILGNNGHGSHDRVTGLDMNYLNDASNLNEPLSRNIAMVPIHKSSSFTPVSTNNGLPVQTPLVSTFPKLSSPDPLDTLSTYTADGDGDLEIVDVTDTLKLISSTGNRRNHEQSPGPPSDESPLFTPPPEDDTHSIHHFTPHLPPKPNQSEPLRVYSKPRTRKCFMSHIEVPPLKRPRSDYRPDYRPTSKNGLPTIVHKRRVASNSVQEALQASFQNNADVGVFSGSLEKQQRKRMKQRRDGGAEIVVGHPNGTKKMLKRSFIDDDDDWGPPPKSKKPRPISKPMIVDLTITTDDDDRGFPPPHAKTSSTSISKNPKPKVKPTPKLPIPKPMPRPRPLKGTTKFIHAKYDSATDIVTLCLEDIRPLPLEILTRNLRQSLGNDLKENKDSALGPVNIDRTRQNGSKPCLMIVPNPSSTTDCLEEVSVGGVVREFAEEFVEVEVIDLLSDSDALKENVPQKNVPPVPTPLASSSLKNQHQKKPRGPYIKPKPRHHPIGDDVNGSSSSFKVPAPRAIPDTTEYPKTQYPKKKGREPQHGQQQQPRKEKQSSDTTNPVQISPWTAKLAPQHPKKPLESQLLQPSQSDSPVRPPHSARSSLNGQIHGSESDYFNDALPSAKALGKRRAISPMSIPAATSTSHILPFSPNVQSHRSPSSGLTHNPYGLLNGDFNVFMDDPTPMSSAVQSFSAKANEAESINSFSLSNSYHPLDTLASLYDQAASSNQIQSEIHIGSDMDSSRHTSTTHSHVLGYDDVGGGAWSSSLFVGNHQREDQIYAYETIDPTLLGGGPLLGDTVSDTEMIDVDMVGMEAGFDDDQVRQKEGNRQDQDDARFSTNNDESSSTDSSYSSASPRPKKPYKKKKVVEVKETVSYERKLPPRNRTKRVIPDMLSHDDFDLMLKRKKAVKKKRFSFSSTTNNSAPDGDSADRSSSGSEQVDDDDDENENEKSPIAVRKPISTFQSRASLKDPIERSISPPPTPADKKLTATRLEKQDWPMDEVDAYCHQCRRKTFYAKMTCADCQKKFCVRCYIFRYPECEFDADDEEYSCPACEGFCNCTACCRKRGEAYVGVRRVDKSTPPPPPPPSRPRVKLGAKTNLPPLSTSIKTTTIKTTAIPEGATNAWGSLYSVTGEKIGACFFDPSAEKDSSIVFAPATTPIMTTMAEVAQQVVVTTAASPSEEPKIQAKKTKKTKKHKRRIFIGDVQKCWGYTKPKIRLLEAEPHSFKRSYNSMPRYYIGKKKYLFYSVEEDESSLTDMDESDEVQELQLEGGGDVEGKSFLPDSLGDGDVTRAIFLGLTACGLAAMPSI